ncbi:MAG: tetratricopeptide repeat protein [Acidobacteriota bacterium]|nr:tetratricopeptide repeat protein [Acidobacteriota bacterium]
MSVDRDPYVGPRPFEVEDREFFFGRDLEANELVSLIISHPAVLLYSQSGAGKTSLIKAGVIRLLTEEEKFDVLPPARVREQGAFKARAAEIANVYVFNALVSMSREGRESAVEEQLQEKLARTTLAGFLEERRRSAGRAEAQAPTVIIFDQFEELFTFYPERWGDRRGFFEQVRDALGASPLLRVVFSMREDFIAELDPYVHILPEKLRTRLRIERLRNKSALCAVTKPLEAGPESARRKFAPGVAEELVDNLLRIRIKTKGGVQEMPGEFIEPLQLQVVCQALWRSLQPRTRVITKKHLKTYGDVDQALTQFYEEAVRGIVGRTNFREGVLRRWFERALITPTGTRGIVFRGESETAGLPNEVLDELENQRLVRVELRGGEHWYELTHDRLIRTIKAANQKWLLGRSGAEQTRLRLETKAGQWAREGRAEAGLLDEAELLEAERWIASPEAADLGASDTLLELVKASRVALAERQQEAAEERRHIEERARVARRMQWLAASLALVTLVALAAAVYAIRLKSLAEGQRKIAEENVLKAAEAQRQRDEADRLAAEARRKAIEAGQVANAANERLTLVEKIGKLHGLAQTQIQSGDYAAARGTFGELIKLYEKTNDPSGQARILRRLGDVYYRERKFAQAADSYNRALSFKGASLGKKDKGVIYTSLAGVYYDWGPEHDRSALQSAEAALKLFQAENLKSDQRPMSEAVAAKDRIEARLRSEEVSAKATGR